MNLHFDPNSPVISLLGLSMDVLGGLYLAYDLLGGKNGPLRLLTRVVTYGVFYFFAYTLLLGVTFGIVAGISLGSALGIELSRVARKGNTGGFPFQLFMAAVRGFALGLAVWLTVDRNLGPLFGFFSWLTLSGTYFFKVTPSDIYMNRKLGLSADRIWAVFYRGLAVAIAGVLASLLVHANAAEQIHAIWIGVCVALASMIVTLVVPIVEQWTDELPAQKLGMLGTTLFLLGFCLQAVPYVAACMHLGIGMNPACYEHK